MSEYDLAYTLNLLVYMQLLKDMKAKLREAAEERETLAKTLTRDGGNIANSVTQRYQLSNNIESATLELDDTAQIISYEEYYPYGDTSYMAGANASEVSQKRYRYTGKEKDEESGLYYMLARYYSGWLGRWTASDPAGLVDGVNLYMYCRGNPVGLLDPNGKEGIVPRHNIADQDNTRTDLARLRKDSRQQTNITPLEDFKKSSSNSGLAKPLTPSPDFEKLAAANFSTKLTPLHKEPTMPIPQRGSTTPASMQNSGVYDPKKITIAAKNAVSAVKASDPEGKEPAKCNIGVRTAFKEITGSTELHGMDANNMYDHMNKSENFAEVNVSEVQDLANAGHIIVAAYKAATGSGHVALAVPDSTNDGGKWNKKNVEKMPHVMDTGENKRYDNKCVTNSFGKEKQGSVKFFMYTPQNN
jgi:RHS repeat-associated protein